ncbi:hypothetical protein P9272_29930 [Mesorhizobium sp. WSM4976]|uniref:hypothetical protein n=1 Tax=Mesorhizobium sp. WSM4976 TaxID=3038549 RepID=UPI00241757B2|nr:hypothetical protein [Mesorhizobium sp. WSM4976]MDG4897763.1 hypothetical protein [Mesorhizobium sp. WSM4976]
MVTIFGSIIARRLRDRLVRLADQLAATPRDLSATVVRSYRDRRIRELGLSLQQAMPSAAVHKVASILAAAGRSVEQGCRLSERSPFHCLRATERVDLEQALVDFIG